MIKIIHINFMTVIFIVINVSISVTAASELSATPAADVEYANPWQSLEGEDLEKADLRDAYPTKEVMTLTEFAGSTGYRFLSVDDYGGRASKYNYLHSGIVGGANYSRLGQDLKLSLDGDFLNSNDYYGDFKFDYAGNYRLHIRTDALYHNLEGERLFSTPFKLGAAEFIPHQEEDSLVGFGLRTEQDSVTMRYKIQDFPLHLNISYWRMIKKGTTQIRFADMAFEGNRSDFFSRSRSVNRETHEGKIGFDSHLGPVDLIYSFQLRQFINKSQQLRDNFFPRNDFSGGVLNRGGFQEHNEDPESRNFAHTVKMHTSLAGGIVGAASVTYGKRDNFSKLNDTKGADNTSLNQRSLAGDLVYTPFKELSLGVKYRRQEINNDNPTTVTNSFFADGVLMVRPSISTEKDIILATLLFRPINIVTIKGEYKGEFLHRDLTHYSDTSLNWYLNENQKTHKGSISAVSRPLKGLRLSARYGYTSTDHPSYGISFAQKHEGELTTNYNITNKLGLTASYRNIRELNDEIQRRILTLTPLNTIEYSPFSPLLSRDKSTHNFTTALWFAPVAKMTITTNYGFLQHHTDQAVMFSIFGNGSLAASSYNAESHLYSISSSYQFTDSLNLSLMLQEVHSLSEFRPESSADNDTSGVTGLSRVKTVETSFSARSNYRISKHLTCSMEYMLQDYYDKMASQFDGTVHTVMATLSAKW